MMRITELHRYPVKSMRGERLEQVEVSESGFVHDRQYGLVDVESGKAVSAKRPNLWGRMLELTARCDGEDAVVEVDGHVHAIGDPELPGRLSAFLGREVGVLDEAPGDAVFEEAWEPDLKGGIPPFLGNVASAEDDGDIIQVPLSEGMRDFGAAPGLHADRDALRTITRVNRAEVLGTLAPCVGAYAQPRATGTIRVGDEVRLRPA